MHTLWGSHAFALDVIANEEFLERAQDAPIDVLLISSSPIHRWELGVQHVLRARALEASGGAPLEALTQGLGGCFRLLETMRLLTVTKTVISLPQTFSAPNLRTLRLSDVVLDFGAVRSTNLTTLALHISYHHPNMSLPMDFLDFLMSCPGLRELDLRGCIPHLRTESIREEIMPISLPWLAELTLVQNRAAIVRFWSVLRIPSTASINISFDDARMLDASPLMTYIEDTYVFSSHVLANNGALPPVSALKIAAVNDGNMFYICLRLYHPGRGTGTTCTLDKSATTWTRKLSFDCSVHRWTASELAAAIGRFSSIFRLSPAIKLLSIEGDGIHQCLHQAGLPPVYEQFHAVQTLHLDFYREPEAFTPLGNLFYAHDSSCQTSSPPCPALETLYLSNFLVDVDEDHHNFDYICHPLGETLYKRNKHGYRVRTLDLEHAEVSPLQHHYLSSFVDSIRVYP
ncbi:unnamed protein product [Peniophora sp. CBMAI 1063]|nr:unnamed protein product [Peniophora sp. CBMAI 1063]